MKSCLCYFFICLIGSIYSFHLAASISADFISVFFSRQNSSLALHNKHSFAEDSAGAYPLVLRISVRETSILTVKISKKVMLSYLTDDIWLYQIFFSCPSLQFLFYFRTIQLRTINGHTRFLILILNQYVAVCLHFKFSYILPLVQFT